METLTLVQSKEELDNTKDSIYLDIRDKKIYLRLSFKITYQSLYSFLKRLWFKSSFSEYNFMCEFNMLVATPTFTLHSFTFKDNWQFGNLESYNMCTDGHLQLPVMY